MRVINICFFLFLVGCSSGMMNDVLLQFVQDSIHEVLDSYPLMAAQEQLVTERGFPSSQSPSEASKLLQFRGSVLEKATVILREKHGVSNYEEVNRLLSSTPILEFNDETEKDCGGPPRNCQDPIHDRIRSITGYCNNRNNPTQANALTPIRRLLGFASYADGLGEIRSKSVTGSPLPSPRLISNKLHDTGSAVHESPDTNHLHMQIGQFIAHDLIFMPTSSSTYGGSLDCTSCSSAKTVSPHCAPIPVPSDDKYFTRTSPSAPRCLRFIRASNAQTGFGVRTQLDQNTHYLDMSTVYGSSECEARTVRSYSNGLLRTYTGMGYVLPPQNPNDSNCQSKSPYHCFTAGDFRNSLHPGLLPLHSVFLKEHNRLAAQVKQLRPSWNDEQIYQLVRKIMIAQWQHVVYNEYLPKLLNEKFMNDFGLKPSSGRYNPSMNAVLSVEFAAAAFRFGHSQSRQNFVKMNTSMTTIDKYDLGKNIFYSDEVYKKSAGGWETMLLGLISVGAMKVDRYFSFPIRNQLFEVRGQPGSGVDLVSVNIMRGRDVGLSPYAEYRSRVGLPRISSWNNLSSTFSENNIAALKSVYANPKDIDLFTGIVMEQPLSGSQLGPTASWIIAEQFRASKQGDRFFYENKVQGTVGLNNEQLNAIRQVKLSKILCENMEMISSINSDIFSKVSNQIKCSSMPTLDIKLFV